MNYFYERNNSLHNRSLICYPDDSGVIKPLITTPTQISVLEWEIIEELEGIFTNMFPENWSLYFKYPTVTPNRKYIFYVLLISSDSSIGIQEKKRTVITQVNFILTQKYHFIERVSIKFHTINDLHISRNFQFQIKVLYYRVAGVDVESMFEDFRMGFDSIQLLPVVHLRIEEFKRAAFNTRGTMLKQQIEYIIKLLIRAAFELVSDKEKIFTRDLNYCSITFGKHYPSHAHFTNSFLHHLTMTDVKIEAFMELIDEFGKFLSTEYKNLILK